MLPPAHASCLPRPDRSLTSSRQTRSVSVRISHWNSLWSPRSYSGSPRSDVWSLRGVLASHSREHRFSDTPLLELFWSDFEFTADLDPSRPHCQTCCWMLGTLLDHLTFRSTPGTCRRESPGHMSLKIAAAYSHLTPVQSLTNPSETESDRFGRLNELFPPLRLAELTQVWMELRGKSASFKSHLIFARVLGVFLCSSIWTCGWIRCR